VRPERDVVDRPEARSPDRQLGVDSDIETSEDRSGAARPVHLSWTNIGLVAAGGAVGTGVRYLISAAFPQVHGIPVATLGINVVGAFLLGALLEAVAMRGVDAGRRRAVRLLAGTGALGGFTTYSTLANDTATLMVVAPVHAVGYALATVVGGAAAALAGIVLARRLSTADGKDGA
jgi:CrcB protein